MHFILLLLFIQLLWCKEFFCKCSNYTFISNLTILTFSKVLFAMEWHLLVLLMNWATVTWGGGHHAYCYGFTQKCILNFFEFFLQILTHFLYFLYHIFYIFKKFSQILRKRQRSTPFLNLHSCPLQGL